MQPDRPFRIFIPANSFLLRVRFMQPRADRHCAIRVHCTVTLFHVLNFSFLVDDDRCALRPLIFSALHIVGLQNLVGRKHFFVHVAEEGKCDADLLCECSVGGGAVDADSEDDCITCFELGQISLIGLEFFRSTTCECQDVEGKDDVFLSAIIAQLHLSPFIA